MGKRVAIYARVSLDRDQNKATIENQVEACTKLCEARGFNVAKVFSDRDKSGWSKKNAKEGYRKDYDALKQGVIDGEFDLVVAYRLDRLSRSVSDLLKLALPGSVWVTSARIPPGAA